MNAGLGRLGGAVRKADQVSWVFFQEEDRSRSLSGDSGVWKALIRSPRRQL